jgi:hypothetical protein
VDRWNTTSISKQMQLYLQSNTLSQNKCNYRFILSQIVINFINRIEKNINIYDTKLVYHDNLFMMNLLIYFSIISIYVFIFDQT